MYLWRISNHADLSGRGGIFVSGRWHKRGNPIVYCADHPSTALLEVIVHMDLDEMPSHYTLLRIFCPDGLPIKRVEQGEIEAGDIDSTQAAGTALLVTNEVCLIDVPSVIMPQARNILINPRHPAADQISIEETLAYPFDSRLFR